MRKWVLAVVVCWVGLNSTGAWAKNGVDNPKLLHNSGEVRGTVQCVPGTSPATGAVVYLSGESFVARTNELGEFTLRYVPAGTYDLVIEVSGQEVHRSQVQVPEQTAIEVDRTVACPPAAACSFCGDGVVDAAAGEQCDQGGVDTATCNSNCTLPFCGDGHVNLAAGEQCELDAHCPSGFRCAACRCVPQ
jgi:carboxypeptidase-like protein